MIGFADMITIGPVYVHRLKGEYRCVWTPLGEGGKIDIHGIGLAEQPYLAVARAVADAKLKGWRE